MVRKNSRSRVEKSSLSGIGVIARKILVLKEAAPEALIAPHDLNIAPFISPSKAALMLLSCHEDLFTGLEVLPMSPTPNPSLSYKVERNITNSNIELVLSNPGSFAVF